MNWKEFVKEGKTIRTHTPIKGKRMLEAPTDTSNGHTTIWLPRQKVQ